MRVARCKHCLQSRGILYGSKFRCCGETEEVHEQEVSHAPQPYRSHTRGHEDVDKILSDLALFGSAAMRVNGDGSREHVELQSVFVPAEKPSRRHLIRVKVMARVTFTAGPLETECWLWDGPDSGGGRGGGYPRMCLDGQTVAVHKVIWTNEHGFVPGKKQLDHLCRDRRCVNPDHLELVTHKENQRRRDRDREKT